MTELDMSSAVIQKIGDLDFKKFKEMLTSFEEPIDELSSKPEENTMQKILARNNICKFCGEFECIADSEEGKFICTKCARDNGEIIDNNQEWRPISCDDYRRQGDPSRIGMPVNEHFMKASLTSIISGYGYQNFRKIQRYCTMDYDERSLYKNFQFIDTSAEDLCPEAVKDHAKNVYKKISENENKRGKKKQSNMAACVYFASERRGENLLDKEKVSESFLVTKKKFTKGCNFFREQLFQKEPAYYAKMKPVSAEDEIKRITKILNMPEVYRNIVCYVAHMAQELGIVIKNTPISIAVGSIFLVSNIYGLNIEKKDIIDKCEISDVTINKSVSLLMTYKQCLIPTQKLYEKFMDLNIV